MKRTLMFAALAVATFAAHAQPTQMSNGVMVGKEGKTLYIFDKDAGGKSTCNGGCAAAWPPFVVADPSKAGGDFSIVKRDDGASQWAFRGKPLYFYAGDTKAGDTNGDKQGGVWHAVRK
ncbi:MAG: hypothetical protein ABJA83_03025 [Burkholderiaceae bacterium]